VTEIHVFSTPREGSNGGGPKPSINSIKLAKKSKTIELRSKIDLSITPFLGPFPCPPLAESKSNRPEEEILKILRGGPKPIRAGPGHQNRSKSDKI
jgi:hypothetical protein